MATVAFSGTDVRVRDAVMRQLAWDPDVDESAVGIAAKDGAVTLTGYIDTYAGKLAAERAAKRVHGVRAVANDLEVRLKLDRTDTDIAQDAARALGLHDAFPDTIQAAVHHGHVALTGTVGKLGLREQAERVVRHIRGVRGVVNHITVSPQLAAAGVKRQIVKALHETADVEARQIEVAAVGGRRDDWPAPWPRGCSGRLPSERWRTRRGSPGSSTRSSSRRHHARPGSQSTRSVDGRRSATVRERQGSHLVRDGTVHLDVWEMAARCRHRRDGRRARAGRVPVTIHR